MAALWRRVWLSSSPAHLVQAQNALLGQFVKTPLHAGRVTLPSSGHALNFVDTHAPGAPALPGERVAVLMHGFGSGLGFFFRNIDALRGHFDRVVAVDWLGMGGSDRPGCRAAPRLTRFGLSMCQSSVQGNSAVGFFTDSLEEWRVTLGLHQPVVLLGHSLGGYLSARYALANPGAVSSLVLASPVGLPAQPTDPVPSSQMPRFLRLLDAAWAHNVTPQQIVRMLGPRGHRLVHRAVAARFQGRFTPEEHDLIADYLYHITVARASGEFAMNSLLTPVVSSSTGRPNVFARETLQGEHLPMPVLLLFGDNDWMHTPLVPGVVEEWRGRGVHVEYDLVPQAGHHLYFDNSDAFNDRILRFVRGLGP